MLSETAERSHFFKKLIVASVFGVAGSCHAGDVDVEANIGTYSMPSSMQHQSDGVQLAMAHKDLSTPVAAVDAMELPNPSDTAVTAAVADGVTTGLALSAGAIETNPLIATNPVGLVAITGLKVGLVKYADTLPTEDKRAVMKTSSALWGGAAANNLLVLLAAPGPVAIVAGLVAGAWIWNHMDDQYQEEDRIIAERSKQIPAPVVVETAAADPAQTSGN